MVPSEKAVRDKETIKKRFGWLQIVRGFPMQNRLGCYYRRLLETKFKVAISSINLDLLVWQVNYTKLLEML